MSRLRSAHPRIPPTTVRLSSQKHAAIVARMQRIAWLLDARFALPFSGGKARFGLDAVVGLIPVVGDALMMLLSLYIVVQAWRLGTGWRTLLKMIGWVIVDFIVGEVPVAGDIADALLKVNLRNLRMIGIEPRGPQAAEPAPPPPQRDFVSTQ